MVLNSLAIAVVPKASVLIPFHAGLKSLTPVPTNCWFVIPFCGVVSAVSPIGLLNQEGSVLVLATALLLPFAASAANTVCLICSNSSGEIGFLLKLSPVWAFFI